MAVTMTQKAGGFGWNATSLNLAYTGSVTSGSGLVATVVRENGAFDISGVSDDVNSTWTQAIQQAGTGPTTCDVGIFYFPNSGSGTVTTTTTTSGTSMITTNIFECPGLDTSTPLADTSGGTGTTGTVDPGSVTPTVADNIVIAAAVNSNTLSSKSGYTDGFYQSNNYPEGSQYKITASTSAENPTFGGTPNGWTAACAVFQAAASGAYTLTANAGTYTVTGQTAGVLCGRYLSAGSGVYTVTGQDVTTLATRLISAASGSYTLSGTDATLVYTPITSDYVLTADAGSYVLSGGVASLLATRLLSMGEGSYLVTGQVLQLLKWYLLSAEAGGYVATGSDAAFLRTYNLVAGQGSYTIIGKDVILNYSGAAPSAQGSMRLILLRRRRRSQNL